MRLINTHTKRFEEFIGETPPYAILSHTWENYEIPFKDFYDLQIHEAYPQASKKIYDTCDQALEDEIDYVWIDSCCIDKSSSAELSEAINSMYTWYSRAKICYAYLADLELKEDLSKLNIDFVSCRWLTRGWTLQELIAPHAVDFFDKNWSRFGNRVELKLFLSALTTIPPEILSGVQDPRQYCVAQKMAWAAKRQTTREEDIAYCLFGLFEINAPLLYGEGGVRAFQRLQEEIMKKTNDLTLFAWRDRKLNGVSSILASHPYLFSNAYNVRPQRAIRKNPEFTTTNKGLRIKTQLAIAPNNEVLMPLYCSSDEKETHYISLLDGHDNTYFRTANSLRQLPLEYSATFKWSENLIYLDMDTKRVFFEQSILLKLPLDDGDTKITAVKVWFHEKYPCNLFNQTLAGRIPLMYKSKEGRWYRDTPEGFVYSQARFEAVFHVDPLLLEPRLDLTRIPIEFEVPNQDLHYGVDAIIGRSTMEDLGLQSAPSKGHW